MAKRALITGITGQDGAYLSRLLLERGYSVMGLTRNVEDADRRGLKYLGIDEKVCFLECDLTDLSAVTRIVEETEPSEIYNLAAQSSVSQSFKQPTETISFNVVSVLNLLEAVRLVRPDIRFYQASSSEIFGSTDVLPINESSAIAPVSPYSVSKAAAYWITRNYRESYGLFCCSGFLFNHESFLRSEDFFVKKVIKQAVRIKNGEAETLEVGNIEIKRDFGWAARYVETMFLMLQQNQPEDFVVSSGESVSLRAIVEFIFDYLNVSIDRLKVCEKLYRPIEISDIYGDSTKARRILGWNYDLSFYDVLEILIDEEIEYFDEHRR